MSKIFYYHELLKSVRWKPALDVYAYYTDEDKRKSDNEIKKARWFISSSFFSSNNMMDKAVLRPS